MSYNPIPLNNGGTLQGYLLAESKLLRSFSRLVTESQNQNIFTIRYNHKPLDVRYDDDTNTLYCANICCYVDYDGDSKKIEIQLFSHYNSRDEYPLLFLDLYDHQNIFDVYGELSTNFVEFVKYLKKFGSPSLQSGKKYHPECYHDDTFVVVKWRPK